MVKILSNSPNLDNTPFYSFTDQRRQRAYAAFSANFSLIFFVSNWVHDDIPPKDYAFREDSNTKTPLL